MKTDLSTKAIATRLRRVSQLRRLCLSLGKAKPKLNDPKDKKTRQSMHSK
jgi:hypothetical protein